MSDLTVSEQVASANVQRLSLGSGGEAGGWGGVDGSDLHDSDPVQALSAASDLQWPDVERLSTECIDKHIAQTVALLCNVVGRAKVTAARVVARANPRAMLGYDAED